AGAGGGLSGGELLTVGAERQRVDLAAAVARADRPPGLGGGDVPHLDQQVVGAGGQRRVVAGQGHGPEGAAVLQRGDRLARGGGPDPGGAVDAARGQPAAVGRERQAPDVGDVPGQRALFRGGGRVPELDGAVGVPRRQQRPVRGERQRQHVPRV